MTAKRILVVEDSRTQAEQLRCVLEEAGYAVSVAHDGLQAIAALEVRPADAVLSDIVMPGEVDGFELCRRIKAGPHADTPVVLLTSLSDPADIIQALECGADNFVRKPYEPSYLLERLRVLFATRELRAKNRVTFGMTVLFMGHEVTVDAGHQQVLDLLISTFEEAVLQNRQLRQSEEELRLATAELDRYAGVLERRLQTVLETIPDALFSVDASLGNLFYVSPGALSVFGYTAEELIADPQLWRRSIHPDDLAAVLDAFDRAVQSRVPQAVECRFRAPKSDWRWLQLKAAAVTNGPEARVRLDGVARDITDQRRAEEELRRSEADHRGLVEHAPLGIYRSTIDGRFVAVNQALVGMLGYTSAEEFIGLSLPQDVYVDPEERNRTIGQFAARTDASAEVAWKRKDGTPITVRLHVRTVRNAAGAVECFEGFVEDVTERRSVEEQFRQAQKMEAVGRLAGGVAHDFNNVLTVITTDADLLLDDLEPGDPRRADVEEIRDAALSATALTRQLLAFSRKQVLQPRALNLTEVIAALEKMLRRLIGEDVALAMELAPALGTVRADPGQIEQVILNLAVNARDAMPEGGRLTIATSDVDLDEAYLTGHAEASPGRYVQIEVRDTGIGMDAATQSRIFEPFFTTKEVGKGTGLGLATVYGIVKQSGGFVNVYSEPGMGTAFRIYLPRTDEASEPVEDGPDAQSDRGGDETVLVAEDDELLRKAAVAVLGKQGYHVLPVADGTAALALARDHPGEIHVLLTDLIMPGMSGRALAEALVAVRPSVRILFMSGYTDDTVLRQGVLDAGVAFLQKPFNARALARKVREVLDAR
jgi:PAS domain S-box-containing protein